MRLPRRAAARRWGAVLAVGALIAAIPAVIGARGAPADDAVPVAALVARIRASTQIAFSGYAESHGSLAVPDVAQLGDLPSLLGDTTKMRVWWDGPQQSRVDVISDAGENDTYQLPGGAWEWDSEQLTATYVTGAPAVRVPRAPDLLPSQLGVRLAGAASTSILTRLPARSVAGRTADGVEITPTGLATTISSVDVWADRATGIPLLVTVSAAGQSKPVLTTSFLTFDAHTPSARTTTFSPPIYATLAHVDAGDLRGLLGHLRFVPPLPELAGLPATAVAGDTAGIRTYGRGLAVLAVVALDPGDGYNLAKSVQAQGKQVRIAGADGLTLTTPLVDTLLVGSGRRAYLLAGTVPLATLEKAAAQLLTTGAGFRPGNAPSAPPGTGA